MREHHRCNRNAPTEQVSLGDVVLISEEKLPRNRWRMGVCVELRPGKDGLVRSCKVRTLTKGNKITHIIRPIEKLYPLEIRSRDTQDAAVNNTTSAATPSIPTPDDSSMLDSESDSPTSVRPQRVAAIEGVRRRREAMNDES